MRMGLPAQGAARSGLGLSTLGYSLMFAISATIATFSAKL
jgi:hypothetical protein